MTALILPNRGLIKPPPGIRPESSHPSTHGMLGWWLMNDAGSILLDVVGFRHASSVTNPQYRKPSLRGGACLWGNGAFDGCSASVPNSVLPDSLLTSGPISIAFWHRHTSGLNAGLFGKGANPNPNPLMINGFGSGADISLTRGHATGSRRWDCNGVPINTWTHITIVCTDNLVETDPVIYFNGIPRTSFYYTSGTATGAVTGNNSAFTLGSNAYSGNHGDAVDDVRLFNRALSPDEIDRIIHAPFDAFPRRQVLYFDMGGGNTPSAADSGALTLTGSAADGIRALLSAADASNLTITGSAANGVRALAGVAVSGSITLTGSAANAVRALAGVAASGSITLTGSNAAALRTWLGIAGAGSITLTGSDAVGVKAGSGAYTSAANAGSITLSGSAAVGTYDRLAAAGSGSITLTGSDASGIRNIPATAEAGSIVLTGSAAVGVRTWLAAAEAGSITLSGSDAEGVFGGAMTLTQADLDAIAAAMWADPAAVAAHAKLDAIIARITC